MSDENLNIALGLASKVEVEAQSGQLVIRSVQAARLGWEARFQAMAQAEDDRLIDGEALLPTAWDAKEWEW